MPFGPLFSLRTFRFYSRHSSAVTSLSPSNSSLHPRGIDGKRMPRDNHPAQLALSRARVVFLSVRATQLIPASDLRIVTPDYPPFSMRIPSVSRSRYQNRRLPLGFFCSTFVLGRGSNERPVVAVRLEALFLCRYLDVFISRNGERVL